jgi:hypothetical protein
LDALELTQIIMLKKLKLNQKNKIQENLEQEWIKLKKWEITGIVIISYKLVFTNQLKTMN